MADTRALYLDLLKRCLTDSIYDPVEARAVGGDWPARGHTMIGLARLDNIQSCVESVLAHGIPGDLIEAGVWRGGAAIFMRALLEAHGVRDRVVWVADSFRGLPAPDAERFPADRDSRLHTDATLAVSLETVKANFARYGMLDHGVRFLEGWFRDTLPQAPAGPLAVVRIDGDLYESTTDALVHLYPRLTPGGYVIVDDYGAIEACRDAVHEYRARHAIADEIRPIDGSGIYWRRGPRPAASASAQ
jgi:hypothetical protein